MKHRPSEALKAGFSLVEMLVVIAVIGIIAAIAVPNIGRINESAKEATNRRNAQNLASVYASANAAGHAFPGNTTAEIAAAIVTGHMIPENDQSPFAGTFFGVPGLSKTDLDNAATYLDIQGGQLIYKGHAEDDEE